MAWLRNGCDGGADEDDFWDGKQKKATDGLWIASVGWPLQEQLVVLLDSQSNRKAPLPSKPGARGAVTPHDAPFSCGHAISFCLCAKKLRSLGSSIQAPFASSDFSRHLSRSLSSLVRCSKARQQIFARGLASLTSLRPEYVYVGQRHSTFAPKSAKPVEETYCTISRLEVAVIQDLDAAGAVLDSTGRNRPGSKEKSRSTGKS